LDEDLWARGGARSSFAAEIVLWTIRGTPHSHLPLKCERPMLYLLILLNARRRASADLHGHAPPLAGRSTRIRGLASAKWWKGERIALTLSSLSCLRIVSTRFATLLSSLDCIFSQFLARACGAHGRLRRPNPWPTRGSRDTPPVLSDWELVSSVHTSPFTCIK
jgi:hypothetical protein